METQLATRQSSQLAKRESSKALKYLLNNSLSTNTLKSYKSDLSMFCHWLKGTEPDVTPSGRSVRLETEEIHKIITQHEINERRLVDYLEHISFRHKMSTIDRKFASLSWFIPKACGLSLTEMPILKEVKKSVRRLQASYVAGLETHENLSSEGFDVQRTPEELKLSPAKPMRINVLKRAIAEIRFAGLNTPINIRDAAILSLWWTGAYRRSELLTLRPQDIEFVDQGMQITLNISKTDQFGEGVVKGFHYALKHPDICPVKFMKAWLSELEEMKKHQHDKHGATIDSPGFLFARVHGKTGQLLPNTKPMSDKSMVNILKSRLEKAGIENFQDYSGHSPRRGFVTDAYQSGATENSIQKQGNWKSRTMLDRYREEDTVFEENATAKML